MSSGNISKLSRKCLSTGFALLDRNLCSSIVATQKHCQFCTFHKTMLSHQSDDIHHVENSARLRCIYHLLRTNQVQTISRVTSHYEVAGHRNFHSIIQKYSSNENKKTSNNELSLIGVKRPRHMSLTAKGILDASPLSFQPYLRLIRFDKPIGTWLLYWPCTWSIAMAADAGQLPDLKMLMLFGAGAFVMRGAGCIINDMWDKDFDKKVARTKLRPLASGELTPFQALVFLSTQLSLALAILLQLNYYSIILGAASMGLVVVYPLAKRYTYWPQLILGLTLNWGVLLAWSGLTGSLDWSIVPLYAGCVLYTMFYDTIYSHQYVYSYCGQIRMPQYALCPCIQFRGFTFNYGTMLGWAAIQGHCDWTVVLPLYAGSISWTLVYDTIYAHQDKYDDMLIGVKSTALKFGDHTKVWLSGFASVMVGGLTMTGYLCDQTWPYYLGVSATAAHLAYQLYTVELNDADDCAKKFFANTRLGLIMFLGTVFGTLLKESKPSEDQKEKES